MATKKITHVLSDEEQIIAIAKRSSELKANLAL